jgi:hypothetical protein
MRKIRVDHVAALLLLLACTGFFLWRAKHGLRFNTFGDETMHFIGAKALLSGKILYRDYIELHGPLAYAIPQGFFWIFGWGEPLHARAILIVLTAIAALSVGGSPCLGDMWERMVAAAFFLGMITTLWIVQGLCLYNYQPPAGAFMVIALALTVFPSWLDVFPRAAVTFLAGCCLALTPFLAFSYGPAAILFFTSAVWAQWAGGQRRQAGAMMAGAAAGVFLMVCWILRFADLRGYFVFHFIHALVDFGPYLHFGLLPAIEVLWIHTAAKDLPQAMGVTSSRLSSDWRASSQRTAVRAPAFKTIRFSLCLLACYRFPRRCCSGAHWAPCHGRALGPYHCRRWSLWVQSLPPALRSVRRKDLRGGRYASSRQPV